MTAVADTPAAATAPEGESQVRETAAAPAQTAAPSAADRKAQAAIDGALSRAGEAAKTPETAKEPEGGEAEAGEKDEGGKEEAPALSERHQRLARQAFGWTPEQLAAKAEKMGAEALIEAIEDGAANFSRSLNRFSRPDRERDPESGRFAPAPEKEEELPVPDADDGKPIKFTLDDSLEDTAASQNRLAARVDHALRLFTEFRESQRDQERDVFFKGIVKDFPDYGGKPIDECNELETEARNRVVLLANDLQDVYAKRGRKLGLRDALDMALNQVEHDAIETRARNDIRRQVEDRRKTAIPRPPQRRKVGTPASGDEKAKAAGDKYLESIGQGPLPL